MKTILLMRHAKSDWDAKVKDDWQRPLTKRGEKNARQMAELLNEEKLAPDLILASSAIRAQKTAEVVANTLKHRCDYFRTDRLYLAEMDVYAREIQKLLEDYKRVLVIGHNPALDCILQILSGRVETLSSSGVAYLNVPIDFWKDFTLESRAELIHLWRPRDL